MQNVWFPERLARFDREVTPDRRVHANGSGDSVKRNKIVHFYRGRQLY
jgi:catalase